MAGGEGGRGLLRRLLRAGRTEVLEGEVVRQLELGRPWWRLPRRHHFFGALCQTRSRHRFPRLLSPPSRIRHSAPQIRPCGWPPPSVLWLRREDEHLYLLLRHWLYQGDGRWNGIVGGDGYGGGSGKGRALARKQWRK